MSDTPHGIDGIGATTIAPGGIDRALRDLWAGEGDRVTRACLFNLVAYGTDASLTAGAAQTASVLAEHSPCRAIVITSQPAGPNSTPEAAVGGFCRLTGGPGKQVCCEQVAVQVGGDARRSLPALVASLLVRDVRVFFWPLGDIIVSDDLVPRFVSMADRTVINSGEFSDPRAGLRAATRLWAGPGGEGRNVSDLCWMHCLPWREALAELLDPPAYRPLLDSVDRVRISYSGDLPWPQGGAQALLYAAWLVGSLGWTAVANGPTPPAAQAPLPYREGNGAEATAKSTADGETRLTARAGNREITVTLEPGGPGAVSGLITGVEVGSNGLEATLSLSPDGSAVAGVCSIGTDCHLPATRPLPRLETANLLAGAIQLHSRQAAWRGALAAMQPWLGAD